MLDRRTIVAGLAGTLPAVALGGTSVLSSPALAQLIERHRAAYRAFCDTLTENGENDGSDEYNAANDAERDAMLAICAYPCRSIEEASAKAAYLLTTADVRDGELQPEHITALLQSFVPAAA